MTGRSIRIYLADGTPGGVRTTQIPGWTGRVVVCPASDLQRAKRVEPNLTGPGIYFLVGEDIDSEGRERVYIGESENVLKRVSDHLRQGAREFQFAIMVVTTDDFLTMAHVGWLEYEFIRICRTVGVATIDNDNNGRATSLPLADQDDMARFIEDIRLVLPVLGFNFARQSVQELSPNGVTLADSADSPVFELNAVGAKATMQIRDGEYVVFKDSTARSEGTPSWTHFRAQRNQLVKDGKLVESDVPGYYVFAESVPFNSPSSAAAIVLARQANGRTEWKVRGTTQTLADWQAQRASAETDPEDAE